VSDTIRINPQNPTRAKAATRLGRRFHNTGGDEVISLSKLIGIFVAGDYRHAFMELHEIFVSVQASFFVEKTQHSAE